jgi:hypothetical protein
MPGLSAFRSSDFGLHEVCIHIIDGGFARANNTQSDMMDLRISEDEADDDSDEEEEEDELDPIHAERRRRKKAQDRLRARAGEPVKPEVSEVLKMREGFSAMLRMVLSE